jgi:hypothetical protein
MSPLPTVELKDISSHTCREPLESLDASVATRGATSSAVVCLQAACNASNAHATNAYVYGFDFQNTTSTSFSVVLHYNNTNAVNSSQGPPYATRLNKVSS